MHGQESYYCTVSFIYNSCFWNLKKYSLLFKCCAVFLRKKSNMYRMCELSRVIGLFPCLAVPQHCKICVFGLAVRHIYDSTQILFSSTSRLLYLFWNGVKPRGLQTVILVLFWHKCFSTKQNSSLPGKKKSLWQCSSNWCSRGTLSATCSSARQNPENEWISGEKNNTLRMMTVKNFFFFWNLWKMGENCDEYTFCNGTHKKPIIKLPIIIRNVVLNF